MGKLTGCPNGFQKSQKSNLHGEKIAISEKDFVDVCTTLKVERYYKSI